MRVRVHVQWLSMAVFVTSHCKTAVLFVFAGWWFVDLDSELGWVPASYLEPRDGSTDDQILAIYEEGQGTNVVNKISRYKVEKLFISSKLSVVSVGVTAEKSVCFETTVSSSVSGWDLNLSLCSSQT